MPKTGDFVTMGKALVGYFYYRGWGSDELDESSLFEVVDVENDPEYGLLARIKAVGLLRGRLATNPEFVIDSSWWASLLPSSAPAMTLAEKEKARMDNEPWVRRRDQNLRDVFKPTSTKNIR